MDIITGDKGARYKDCNGGIWKFANYTEHPTFTVCLVGELNATEEVERLGEICLTALNNAEAAS